MVRNSPLLNVKRVLLYGHVSMINQQNTHSSNCTVKPFQKVVSTITADNGKEFSYHEKMTIKLDRDVFLLILVDHGNED